MLITKFNGLEVKVEFFKFPAGEWHCNLGALINCDFERCGITLIRPDSDDIIKSLLLIDCIRSTLNDNIKIYLNVPYLPYSRQDKRHNVGDPLSLEVFLRLYKYIDYMITYDAHNLENTLELEARYKISNISNCQFIKNILDNSYYDFLVCPDEGAKTKFQELLTNFSDKDFKVVYCHKKRDPKTGKLSGFGFDDESNLPSPMGKGLLIDDICDGGGTFIGLSKLFTDKLLSLDLAVSHGIFSKGLDELMKSFHYIYTTNSYCSLDHERLFIKNVISN